MWVSVGRLRDGNTWDMIPSEVNAYYSPPANEIVFPAGILQSPYFSKDWPEYLAFGAFGSVAGHELSHAFDQSGRLYNDIGKLEDWWTNVSNLIRIREKLQRRFANSWFSPPFDLFRLLQLNSKNFKNVSSNNMQLIPSLDQKENYIMLILILLMEKIQQTLEVYLNLLELGLIDLNLMMKVVNLIIINYLV